MADNLCQGSCSLITPKDKRCRQTEQQASSDWACVAVTDQPTSIKDVLPAVFEKTEFHSLLRCELVSRSWHALLRQPETTSTWCNVMSMSSNFGSSLLWVDCGFKSSVTVKDCKTFFQWLHPRLPGISCLRLRPNKARWPLPEVLSMVVQGSLFPSIELKSGQPGMCCRVLYVDAMNSVLS